nr:helix-turn-helix domain-containing protein [Acidomonas methanolica]
MRHDLDDDSDREFERVTRFLTQTGERLAERAAMRRRHFSRAFRCSVDINPSGVVTRLRLETARERVADSSSPIERTTHAAGAHNLMRRADLPLSPRVGHKWS